MITRLKSRPRLDALDNQRRGAGKKLGRRIYFGMLIGTFAMLVYFFVGAKFTLDADGIVAREKFLVAAEYDSRVVSTVIQPGDIVKRGQVLMQLDSRDIARTLSDFDSRRTELLNQLQEVTSLEESGDELIPLAKAQADRAGDYANRVQILFDKGFTTLVSKNEAMDAWFSAKRDLAELQSDRRSAIKRRTTLENTLTELDQLIADTRRIFNQGKVHSPIDGVVGPDVPIEGQVSKNGEPILQLFTGEPYVLAFLPTYRVYSLEEGDSVVISDGYRTASGVVEKVGGLTDNLPAEFQSTLKKRERQEIFRIKLQPNSGLALGSTVKITSPYSFTGAMQGLRTALFGDPHAVDAIDTASILKEAAPEAPLKSAAPRPADPAPTLPACGHACMPDLSRVHAVQLPSSRFEPVKR